MKAKSRARSCLRILLLAATLSGVVAAAPVVWTEDAARVSTSSSSRNLARHVQFFASEKLTGRGVGTSGIALARDYIAAEFARYGLQPGGENGFLQSFEVAVGVEVKAPSRLRIAGEEALALNRQWVPLALSASAKVEAELVFAGYGITVEGYDDYEGIEVKGKIVLVLRYEPPPKRPDSPFKKFPEHSIHSALRTKANNARDRGAVGMILVDLHNPTGGKANLLPVSMGLWRGGDSLVAVQVERDVIERRLAERGVSLTALKQKIDTTEKPASMALPAITAEIQVTLADIRRDAENVVAVFPGSDPALREESIVIGAHYDHIGFGHYGTRDARAAGTVHPGADDNASGAAVLLELARRFAELPSKPSRTIIFVAFSAEELGLLGSRHFAARAKSVAATNAMINLDMVGRLRGDRITVFGTRSGQNLSPIVAAAAQRLGFELIESDHIGRSDHLSFYSKQIPVLHFFTGLHSDYHRPTDTWEKLNIDGMVRITDLIVATVLPIADAEAPMKFVSLPSGRAAQPKDGGKDLAYLGSIPDYGANTEGVELAGVSEGSPAALAGLRPGDVILQLGDKKIRNIEDLTAALRAQKPSDEVAIVILRAGNLLTVKATLRKRVAAFVRG